MNFRHFGIAVLVTFSALSAAYLAWALPNWIPAVPTALLIVGLTLALSGRSAGYSVGLVGLFTLFLLAIATAIGDAEEPTLSYLAMPRYAWVLIVSAIFLALAWVLQRAQRWSDVAVGSNNSLERPR
jgi:hypothetical protein